MAYADAVDTRQKLGTGAAVLLIEGGLALALITGLATSGVVAKRDILTAFNLEQPKPDPVPPPPVDQKVKDNPSVVDRPKTMIELPTDSGPTFIEPLVREAGADGDSSLGEIVFPREPDPVPSPPPLFKPKNAAPKGKWQQWVTTNDYPTSELRLEHQGVTRYRLSIDTSGRVTDCTVTTSSGYPGLDKATCDNVSRRGKFEPATDQTGAKIAGSFSGSVSWQIPKE